MTAARRNDMPLRARSSRAGRRGVASCVALLTVAVAARASRASPASFQAGEALTYSMSVGMIEAGRARMSVGLPTRVHGHRMVAVQGDAHSADWLRLLAHLDDTYKVVVDVDDLVPRHVVTVETGVRERTMDVAVERTPNERVRLDAHLTLPGKPALTQHRPLVGVVRDPVAALFYLRGARLADGDVLEMLALDGLALYRARARVVGRELLHPDTGPALPTIHVAVEATRIDDAGRAFAQAPRMLDVWLSDDDRRVPWRIAGGTDLGTARFELTSYQPGRPVLSVAAAPLAPPSRPLGVAGSYGRLRARERVRLPLVVPAGP